MSHVSANNLDFAAAQLPHILTEATQHLVVPGITAAIVNSQAIIAHGAAGYADLKTGLTAHTELHSRWFSISKSATVLMALEQVLAGKIDLDAGIGSLLPEIANAPIAGARLRDCLMHRSGLAAGNWLWDGADLSGDRLYQVVNALPLTYPLGHGFHYQNLHFSLLERALNKIGLTWISRMDALRQRLGVFIGWDQSSFMSSHRFAPHGDLSLDVAQPCADPDVSGIISGAGLWSPIDSLAAYTGMLAGQGNWQNRQIFSPHVWNLATTPVTPLKNDRSEGPTSPTAALIGTWWDFAGHRVHTVAGGYRGHVSFACTIPALGIGACAMANRSQSNAAECVAWALLERAAGLGESPWVVNGLREKRKNRSTGSNKLSQFSQLHCDSSAQPLDWAGRYAHPCYGHVDILSNPTGSGNRLLFRGVDLPLDKHPEHGWVAHGQFHGGEIIWPLVVTTTGVQFDPDNLKVPLTWTLTTGS